MYGNCDLSCMCANSLMALVESLTSFANDMLPCGDYRKVRRRFGCALARAHENSARGAKMLEVLLCRVMLSRSSRTSLRGEVSKAFLS